MHHETNMYLRRNKREEKAEKHHLRDDQRYVCTKVSLGRYQVKVTRSNQHETFEFCNTWGSELKIY